jgi:hypothetical protein
MTVDGAGPVRAKMLEIIPEFSPSPLPEAVRIPVTMVEH